MLVLRCTPSLCQELVQPSFFLALMLGKHGRHCANLSPLGNKMKQVEFALRYYFWCGKMGNKFLFWCTLPAKKTRNHCCIVWFSLHSLQCARNAGWCRSTTFGIAFPQVCSHTCSATWQHVPCLLKPAFLYGMPQDCDTQDSAVRFEKCFELQRSKFLCHVFCSSAGLSFSKLFEKFFDLFNVLCSDALPSLLFEIVRKSFPSWSWSGVWTL